jgi:multidrug efflux pump subunit AcrA (membrane-fusion protein)
MPAKTSSKILIVLGVVLLILVGGVLGHYAWPHVVHWAQGHQTSGQEDAVTMSDMPGMETGSARSETGHGATAPKLAEKAPGKTLYHCPMHPNYISDKPGTCPICNMDLVPFVQEESASSGKEPEGHTSIVLNAERRQLIGVQVGMVEKKRVAKTIRAVGRVEYNEMTLATVNLKFGGWVEELMVKSVGETVRKGQPLFSIYSPDMVEAQRNYLNENGLTALNLKYGGWIEELMIKTAGEAVHKDQPLLSIYSPDLLEAQRNYLLARAALASLAEGASAETRSLAEETVKSSRERLALWDFTDEQFQEIEAKGAPQKWVTIVSRVDGVLTERNVVLGSYVEPGKDLFRFLARAPGSALTEIPSPPVPALTVQSASSARERLLLWDFTEEQFKEIEARGAPQKRVVICSKVDGIVTERNIVLGSYVEPERDLFKVADLSTVWMYADVYEYEIPLIKVGQEARVQLSSMPGGFLSGKVGYIYPYLNEQTRTARVRMEFPNSEGKLKPGMYSTVVLNADLGEQLVVDDGAVLFTGQRNIVFVDKGDGVLEPRDVTLGENTEGVTVILSGLSEGEKVVTSGNFLVDSESRLKSALKQGTASAKTSGTEQQPGKTEKGSMPSMPPGMPGM